MATNRKSDAGILSGALLTLAISAAICASLLAGTLYFRKDMESGYKREQQRFVSATKRYLALDEEEQTLRTSYPRFADLYFNKGILGDENRLNWLETLRAAGDRIQMPQFSYRVESQQDYTPGFSLNTGPYRIRDSIMKLDMGLLHEYDLLSMLEFLDRDAKGLYSLDRCLFTRLEPTVGENLKKANIRAECEARWFTINLPGTGIVMK